MQKLINKCDSKSDVCRALGYHINGTGIRKVNRFIEKNNLDISHFTRGGRQKRMYEIIEKKCPVCNKIFKTQKGHKYEKITCSHSCANSFFRSGMNNPNWKRGGRYSYREFCFRHHKPECVICGENVVVEVHHLDGDRNNNKWDNLIPLCPTHHAYCHYGHEDLIINKISKYIKTTIPL